MSNTLAYIESALRVGSMLIQAGQDIKPFAVAIKSAITDGVSEGDWDHLKEQERKMRDILQAPLQPKGT